MSTYTKDKEINSESFTKELKNNSGQAFVEFLLLFVITLTLSFTMLRGFNGNMAERWRALVTVIIAPPGQDIQLR